MLPRKKKTKATSVTFKGPNYTFFSCSRYVFCIKSVWYCNWSLSSAYRDKIKSCQVTNEISSYCEEEKKHSSLVTFSGEEGRTKLQGCFFI